MSTQSIRLCCISNKIFPHPFGDHYLLHPISIHTNGDRIVQAYRYRGTCQWINDEGVNNKIVRCYIRSKLREGWGFGGPVKSGFVYTFSCSRCCIVADPFHPTAHSKATRWINSCYNNMFARLACPLRSHGGRNHDSWLHQSNGVTIEIARSLTTSKLLQIE